MNGRQVDVGPVWGVAARPAPGTHHATCGPYIHHSQCRSFLSSLLAWFKSHNEIFGWLIGASILMLVISIAAVGWVIIRVPADYFARENPDEGQFAHRHPLIRMALIVGKNLLGLVLVAAGILMLVLPGQGVLTILAGLFLLDFPGRHRLIMRLVRRPAVLNSLNWVRERAGREPFLVGAMREA